MKKQISFSALVLIATTLTACGGGSDNSESQAQTEQSTIFSVELTGVKVKDTNTGEILAVDSEGINSGSLTIQ